MSAFATIGNFTLGFDEPSLMNGENGAVVLSEGFEDGTAVVRFYAPLPDWFNKHTSFLLCENHWVMLVDPERPPHRYCHHCQLWKEIGLQ